MGLFGGLKNAVDKSRISSFFYETQGWVDTQASPEDKELMADHFLSALMQYTGEEGALSEKSESLLRSLGSNCYIMARSIKDDPPRYHACQMMATFCYAHVLLKSRNDLSNYNTFVEYVRDFVALYGPDGPSRNNPF